MLPLWCKQFHQYLYWWLLSAWFLFLIIIFQNCINEWRGGGVISPTHLCVIENHNYYACIVMNISNSLSCEHIDAWDNHMITMNIEIVSIQHKQLSEAWIIAVRNNEDIPGSLWFNPDLSWNQRFIFRVSI